MRVHHLNCATMCPYSEKLINGTGSLFAPAKMVCHCLLVETNDGLLLVDTGIGLQDVADPKSRLGGHFVMITRPRLDPEETAARQVERLGFKIGDVRHIIVTHMDLDHAGGLPDFPKAKVHVYAPEHKAAMNPPTFGERLRYRKCQWAHNPSFEVYSLDGERWFGFESVRAIKGVSPEALLVPTTGHTRGHCSIAVNTDDGWLLHCGDAYFYNGEVNPDNPHCTAGLNIFQSIVQIDGKSRMNNQARLRELVRDHGKEVSVFCAHDPVEFSRF